MCMCTRIRLAIAIMKTGTQYVGDVWYIVFFPPTMFLIVVAIYAYWVFANLYLYSAGDISQEDRDAFAEVSKENTEKYMFYFEFWGILWVNAFLIGFSQFV